MQGGRSYSAKRLQAMACTLVSWFTRPYLTSTLMTGMAHSRKTQRLAAVFRIAVYSRTNNNDFKETVMAIAGA